MKILVLEDDFLVSEVLREFFVDLGHEVSILSSLAEFESLDILDFNLAVSDLDLESELDGLKAIKSLVERGIYTICLTGRDSENVIEKVYDSGCDDYIVKPFDKIFFDSIFKRASWLLEDRTKKEFLASFETRDHEFLENINRLDPLLVQNQPILITGETGTGKTHLARSIHKEFSDPNTPFINVNCSELSESLLESELFGHVKGSFTGAVKDKLGKFKLADDGTLFLDELATMPDILQKKILKVIEEKSFFPVGSTKIEKSNFKLICATCDDLKSLVEKGKFRRDLYYRLSGINIDIKPLRERTNDIQYLLDKKLNESKRKIILKSETRDRLVNFHWPGNVRQLKKVMDQLLYTKSGVVKAEDLDSFLKDEEFLNGDMYKKELGLLAIDKSFVTYARENGLKELLNKVEEHVVSHCYEYNEEKVRKTINELKISSNSFYKVMNRHKKREN